MNRMISLGRIMFAGLGLYLAILLIGTMIQSVSFVISIGKMQALGLMAVSLLVSAVLLFAAVWFLIVKGDIWARKLIGKDIDEHTSPGIDITLTMAFRLVSVGAGLLVLRTIVYSLRIIISQIYININRSPNVVDSGQYSQVFTDGKLFGLRLFPDLFQILLLIALAVYLLWGAPHFVRWQVRKTLAFCDKESSL